MNRFASPSTIAHFQSGWLTEVFRGKVELPSKAEMLVHYFFNKKIFWKRVVTVGISFCFAGRHSEGDEA